MNTFRALDFSNADWRYSEKQKKVLQEDFMKILSDMILFAFMTAFLFVMVLIAFHIYVDSQTDELWEEFRTQVEDCHPPNEWSGAGECLMPEPDSLGNLIPPSEGRSYETIFRDRDRIVSKAGACRFGGWYHGKMTGDTPYARSTTVYYPCL